LKIATTNSKLVGHKKIQPTKVMKKILSGVCLLGILLAAGCKKNDNNNTGTNPGTGGGTLPANTWVLSGRGTYTASANTLNGNAISIYNSMATTITFFFEKYPTQDAVYKIVSSPAAVDEVSISCVSVMSDRYGYWSTGNDNKTLTVKMVAGKATFTCSNVWIADKTANIGTVDSVQVSANVSSF